MRICESHYVFRLHLRVLLLRCTLASAPHSYACAAGESRPRCDLRVCAFRAAPRMPHPSRGRMSGRRTCGIKYRLIASASGMCAATFPFFIDRRRWKAWRQRLHLGGNLRRARTPMHCLARTHFFSPAEEASVTRAWVNFRGEAVTKHHSRGAPTRSILTLRASRLEDIQNKMNVQFISYLSDGLRVSTVNLITEKKKWRENLAEDHWLRRSGVRRRISRQKCHHELTLRKFHFFIRF